MSRYWPLRQIRIGTKFHEISGILGETVIYRGRKAIIADVKRGGWIKIKFVGGTYEHSVYGSQCRISKGKHAEIR